METNIYELLEPAKRKEELALLSAMNQKTERFGLFLREEEIKELAYKCSFMNTRTIGQFKVLTIEDMENIYRAAK